MKVPLLDLTRIPDSVAEQLTQAFSRVLSSGHFILGPEVEAFEQECATYLGASHALAVSSGTDALLMALMALEIGPGDEVICPSYTFFATGGSIARVGATPVFVDSSPCCYNLALEAVSAAITPRTKAIMPVHLYGQSAEMGPLMELAHKHGLAVIEDAAQAFGAKYRNKALPEKGEQARSVGTLGTMGCYSFFPTKNLGALGDAGLVTTEDEALALRLRRLRMHGEKVRYHHERVGGNFRIDALQAAFLRVKLPLLEAAHGKRGDHARAYRERFLASGLAGFAVENCLCELSPSLSSPFDLLLPFQCQESHLYNQFVIRVPGTGRRDELRKVLAQHQIGTEIYYPVPLHRQECFAKIPSARDSLPWAELFAAETVALPVFPELRPEELEVVADRIIEFLSS